MGEAFDHSADARRREVLSAVRKAWLDVYLAGQAWELVPESRPFFELPPAFLCAMLSSPSTGSDAGNLEFGEGLAVALALHLVLPATEFNDRHFVSAAVRFHRRRNLAT